MAELMLTVSATPPKLALLLGFVQATFEIPSFQLVVVRSQTFEGSESTYVRAMAEWLRRETPDKIAITSKGLFCIRGWFEKAKLFMEV